MRLELATGSVMVPFCSVDFVMVVLLWFVGCIDGIWYRRSCLVMVEVVKLWGSGMVCFEVGLGILWFGGVIHIRYPFYRFLSLRI